MIKPLAQATVDASHQLFDAPGLQRARLALLERAMLERDRTRAARLCWQLDLCYLLQYANESAFYGIRDMELRAARVASGIPVSPRERCAGLGV